MTDISRIASSINS